jgi:thiol-disulfide isomerase/thioredoxin
MSAGLCVALSAVVIALAIGAFRATTNGRFRGSPEVSLERRDISAQSSEAGAAVAWDKVREALPEAQLGGRATLLQFSSAFCAPCRATRRVLADVADVVPGVVHVEVDAEHHLHLVRTLRVLRTPTTIIFDAYGAEVGRASGAPRKEQVLSALPKTA